MTRLLFLLIVFTVMVCQSKQTQLKKPINKQSKDLHYIYFKGVQ